ncbi:MAG: hypothetical protein LBD80_00600, partial [Tannerella sp.]|nr:hypothetical protein [Tannerella sp.]
TIPYGIETIPYGIETIPYGIETIPYGIRFNTYMTGKYISVLLFLIFAPKKPEFGIRKIFSG